MAIADDDIDRIRSSVSIVDVVSAHVQLRKTGRNWVGLCPFHAERSPSFNVREETGRYKCFGCDASGDVFRFVQEIEHVDFVTAVEQLAATAGIQLTYTSTGQSRERARRKRLIEAMDVAVEWYHQRLLTAPDARPARDYLRARGISGEVARTFKLGWAPDDWDVLAREAGIASDLLRETGLAFTNSRGRDQDAFRARLMFPIFDDNGQPVAFGGRVLPGSSDPAKYKNSPETPIYTKSRTLYGLNWSKAAVVKADQVIVCEGYTDVIGFHQAGVGRAVATCGTAFTEEHVRTLKRYASRVVLAFDADAAGQGAAERFYEWEQKYQVEVTVARLEGGKDPGDLAQSDPAALTRAVEESAPFLGFRVDRVLASRPAQSPEQRARLAEMALKVVNEHPNVNVRKLYAGQVATHLGLPIADLVRMAERQDRAPQVASRVGPRARGPRENAEFVALALLVQRWNEIAPWLVGALFADDVYARAFTAVAEAEADLPRALEVADPEAREVIERAAVVDFDADPELEARNLIAAAVRRRLQSGARGVDSERVRSDREARLYLEDLHAPATAPAAAEWLLTWLVEGEGTTVDGG